MTRRRDGHEQVIRLLPEGEKRSGDEAISRPPDY
jgi:hypothetical protein